VRLTQVRQPVLALAPSAERAAQREQCPAFLPAGVGQPGDGQRLLGPRLCRTKARSQEQRVGLAGQDPGPRRRRELGGNEVYRLLVGVQRRVAGPHQVGPQPCGEQPGPDRLGAPVNAGQGGPDQGYGVLLVAGQVGGFRGPPQQPGPVQRQPGRDLGDLVPQLKGAFEVALGLGKGQALLGRHPGGHCGWEGPGQVVALVPVHGHLGRGLGGRAPGQLRLRGQAPGEGGMQLAALAGQQVGLHHLAQQRVPEPVDAAVRVSHQHLVLDGLTDRRQQRRL
jgi:hypothetical protein